MYQLLFCVTVSQKIININKAAERNGERGSVCVCMHTFFVCFVCVCVCVFVCVCVCVLDGKGSRMLTSRALSDRLQ